MLDISADSPLQKLGRKFNQRKKNRQIVPLMRLNAEALSSYLPRLPLANLPHSTSQTQLHLPPQKSRPNGRSSHTLSSVGPWPFVEHRSSWRRSSHAGRGGRDEAGLWAMAVGERRKYEC
jgi:hypothetical protein